MKSLNQRYKQSGSALSFKDWVREDLNETVHKTVKEFAPHNGASVYLSMDGSCSTCNPDLVYKPVLSNQTILGVNKYIVYGVGGIIILFSAYQIYNLTRKN